MKKFNIPKISKLKKYFCCDCPTEINWGSERCKKCAGKQLSLRLEIKSNNYKDGRTLKDYFCKCGKKIYFTTALYGEGQCTSCAKKGNQWNVGKKLPKEHCENIAKGNTGRIVSQETKEKIKKSNQEFCRENPRLGENNPFFGKKHSDEFKTQQSLNMGGTGVPYENNEYGGEFDSALKEQVRLRDNYKCQICGCTQLENGRALDVHHVDYNKFNCKINNLISLCISCHRRTNNNRKYWIEYFKGEKYAFLYR